jgi:hypothetical protein
MTMSTGIGRGAPGVARARDLSGRRFGALQVVRRAGVIGDHAALWFCRCDCGVVHVTRGDRLRVGRVQSCGRWCPARRTQ